MGLLMLMALASAHPLVVVSPLTTAQLAQHCQGSDANTAATFCSGYIIGAFDTLSMTRQICPVPARATTAEVLAMVRTYLREHPQKWDNAPSFVVREVLRAAFPCKRR